MDIEELGWRMVLCGSEWGSVAGAFERGNDPSGSIKGWEDFFTSWVTISFSWRSLLYVASLFSQLVTYLTFTVHPIPLGTFILLRICY
jgi:hypothetical protein